MSVIYIGGVARNGCSDSERLHSPCWTNCSILYQEQE